jgi:hypothetical protein
VSQEDVRREWRVVWKRRNNPVAGKSRIYYSPREVRERLKELRRNRPARQGEVEWIEVERRDVRIGRWRPDREAETWD